MPSASITSTINTSTVVGASRNDATTGSVVSLSSTNTHTTYAWTLAYKPPGSAATFSGSSSAASPGTFTVDLEGPYLVRLTADLGLGTESTQYVRIRYPTVLGPLYLTAAGEGYGGSIPVPVDQTSTGWTNALNSNLMTLLGLVQGSLTSGNVFTVDPTEGYGDYTTIQAAIDAADTAGASSSNPFVVLVRPGIYDESVTFRANIYVSGWPGTPADAIGFPLVLVRGVHTVSTPGGADRVILARMTLSNITSSTDHALQKLGSGSLTLHECTVEQNGVNAAQGAALSVDAGTVVAFESRFTATSALPDDRAAILQPAQSNLAMYRCEILGPTGIVTNDTFDSSVVTILEDCGVSGSGVTGFGILSDSTALQLTRTYVSSANTSSIFIHPSGGAFADDQVVLIRYSIIAGTLEFDATGILGSTELTFSASEYGSISFPGLPPSTLGAGTQAATIFYDNTASGMAAAQVQQALDEVYSYATLVRTLDDAYDGGVPASGGGRIIVADQGAVRISNAPVPADPPEPGDTNGRLEVVSRVSVGAIGAPEIDLDPNPYGAGSAIVLGNRVVPNNTPWSAGTTMVMGNSTGSPLFRNYDLRVQTKASSGGGAIGRLILQGGDGLPNGVTTPDGSSVYLQAGSAFDATAVPGSVFIAPGSRTGGASGSIYLVRPENSTAATLTAAGACANPIGVTGSITFATNMGAVTLNVAAVDTRATVIANLAALEGITAVDSGGGVIRITTDHLGANAMIYFLSATAGVDAAIGGFDGQVQVDGTYAQYVDVQVTADQEVSFGVTGAMGPLVYNADTGKLTVPGIIDPTAVVFETASAPTTGATEGAVFVSDGSGGLTAGHFYFRGPSNAVPADISIMGVVPPLDDVLAAGNTTGGTSIVLSAGDGLDASNGVLLLPLAAVPAQTAEGSVVWDSNDDVLTVGTGAARKTLVDTDTAQTLSSKSFLITDASGNAVTDVVTFTHTSNAGVGANGIGAGLSLQVENSASATVPAVRMAGVLVNATAGAEEGALALYTRAGGGALTERWRVNGDGSLTPTVTNTYSVGSTAARASLVAYRDENSSGYKAVGTVSKVALDSPYTVAATDYVILYDPSLGSSTVNLPAAADLANRVLLIKHASSSANTVTVEGSGAETIDGSLTVVLTSYQSLMIISNGSNWFIL